MGAPRILIDQRLSEGATIALDEAESRHLGAVLRRGAGDRVRLFNARDGEWGALIADISKRGVKVSVENFIRSPRAAPDLDLLFAPVKRHATDLIVEKATELGVRRIRPVITQRTIAETVRLDRLEAIAREAAEQTERFEAPEICEPLLLARALDGWDPSRTLIYADEGDADEAGPSGAGRRAPLGQAIADFKSDRLALLIGPEGGFTSEERKALYALAFVNPVSLGPRILRADTAAIAALALIQALWGDWRQA
jgi:16S rRNA (uracil1498-N3)-methyltransferase